MGAMETYRYISYYWSMALLIFSMVVVVYAINQEWSNPPWDYTHPSTEIIIFFVLLCWIALLEGCQISYVGLQGVDMKKHKDTYPRT